MSARPDADAAALSRLATLLADTTRAAMCLALLDGRAWTAGELARHTGVAASTASQHLDQLVAGGLLAEERQGRHRYLRLSGPQVAQLVEDLGSHAGPSQSGPRSLRAVGASEALARGRTCYDHLAGRLGVAVLDALAGRGLVDVTRGIAVTSAGLGWLAELGIDVDALGAARRPMARVCIDWTERRPHLAGAAGAALCARLIDLGWLRRTGRPRVVEVTGLGQRELERHLGIVDSWAAPQPLEAAVGGR